MWKEQFDNNFADNDEYVGHVHRDTTIEEVKDFISNTHKEIFTDFQEAMGQEWFAREVKVKQLMEKWDI